MSKKIDEEELIRTINDLEALIASCKDIGQRAEHALSKFKKIALVPPGVLPLDDDTGELITDERREEIYRTCHPKALEIIKEPEYIRPADYTEPEL